MLPGVCEGGRGSDRSDERLSNDARPLVAGESNARAPAVRTFDGEPMDMLKTSNVSQSVVANIGLADWGHKELRIAETEMPSLMAI